MRYFLGFMIEKGKVNSFLFSMLTVSLFRSKSGWTDGPFHPFPTSPCFVHWIPGFFTNPVEGTQVPSFQVLSNLMPKKVLEEMKMSRLDAELAGLMTTVSWLILVRLS